MEIRYQPFYSNYLNRDMNITIYGHAGRPVLFIPCQDGHANDFEGFHMTDTWSPWIESGQVMVYAIDTIDQETWSNKDGDPAWRIQRHEDWMRYITEEVAPFIRNDVNYRNNWDGYPQIFVFGCSLGATHAVNLFYRFPDIFDRLLALSGVYNAEYGFGNYKDGQTYFNSPVDYLAQMPFDHPYIGLYNQKKSVICIGQGAWEMVDSTRQVDDALKTHGINTWVDYWGYDCDHDWPWWHRQVQHFVPYLLDQY